MNRDTGLSATQFGFGAGILFLSYCLFEIPSNVASTGSVRAAGSRGS